MQFEAIVARWQEAQSESIDARIKYECAHAEALLRASGKTAEVREAQADIGALETHRVAKHAAVEAQALMHQLVYQRSAAGTAVAVPTVDSGSFNDVLLRWREAQHDAVDAWLHHESEYATALINSERKSAEVRKAEAKLHAVHAQRKAEQASVGAQVFLQLVLYLRSGAGLAVEESLLAEAGICFHAHGAAA